MGEPGWGANIWDISIILSEPIGFVFWRWMADRRAQRGNAIDPDRWGPSGARDPWRAAWSLASRAAELCMLIELDRDTPLVRFSDAKERA